MTDITDIFNHYLTQCDSVEFAEAEFKKDMHEDSEMRQLYRDWCHNVGSTEKNGFLDYAEEYLESRDDVWNALSDFDE